MFLLVLVTTIATFIFYPRPQQLVWRESNYQIHVRQDFNQPKFYPVTQTVSSSLYQPVADWVGRLILPKIFPFEASSPHDWVFFEVQHAPASAQSLVGKVVRLEWQNQPEIQSYIKAVTRDIEFTPVTKKSQASGMIHPARLDSSLRVGPLRCCN